MSAGIHHHIHLQTRQRQMQEEIARRREADIIRQRRARFQRIPQRVIPPFTVNPEASHTKDGILQLVQAVMDDETTLIQVLGTLLTWQKSYQDVYIMFHQHVSSLFQQDRNAKSVASCMGISSYDQDRVDDYITGALYQRLVINKESEAYAQLVDCYVSDFIQQRSMPDIFNLVYTSVKDLFEKKRNWFGSKQVWVAKDVKLVNFIGEFLKVKQPVPRYEYPPRYDHPPQYGAGLWYR
jgi:hypothetical protein